MNDTKRVISRISLVLVVWMAVSAMDSNIPIPQKRPDSSTGNGTSSAPPPELSSAPQQSTAIPEPSGDDPATLACLSDLVAMGVHFEQLPPQSGEEGCGVAAPLAITEISKGVSVVPPTMVNCPTALALANWANNVLLPASLIFKPDAQLISIRQASTYVCRGRNNNPTARLSEHATGNAIDIAALEFSDGSTHAIEPRDKTGSDAEAFQKAIRFGACQYFTTVIGPYSDENHADHLHFDMAERRGGYRLCIFPQITPPAE